MSLVDYTIQARYLQRAVLPRRAQQRAGTKGNSNRTDRAEIHHTPGQRLEFSRQTGQVHASGVSALSIKQAA